MVQFDDVDLEEFEQLQMNARNRGRVSWPILKTFLETGKFLARLDRKELGARGKDVQKLESLLKSYVKNHGLKVNVIKLKGEIYLQRTDIDKDGNKVEIPEEEENPEKPAKDLSDAVVDEEYEETED